MSYLERDDFVPNGDQAPIRLPAPKLDIVTPQHPEALSATNLPALPRLELVDSQAKEATIDRSAIAIHRLVQLALRDKHISARVLERFDEAQAKDLYLQSLDSTERFFLSASVTPIVLPLVQEERLREMAHSISVSKIAIVEQAGENRDLLEFLLQGVNPIGREIMCANLGLLPDHLRTRFDTYTSLASDYSPAPAVLELNGGEPRSDLGSSRMNEIVVGLLYDYLRTRAAELSKIGSPAPSEFEIMRCFPAALLPIERVIERICQVYAAQRVIAPQLPDHFNVGLLVFENPVSDTPLCPISSHEARRSSEYYQAYEMIDTAVGFNPFDIVAFEPAPEGPAGAVLPIVRDENGSLVRVDFIRRLHGEPMENLEVWEKLKSERPHIYYPFTGVSDPIHNPVEQRNFIPMWRWMNPLNSLLTCKRLDAIVTDPELQDRFCVRAAIFDYLQRRHPEWSVGDCVANAEADLLLSAHYTPWTRVLQGADRGGLYQGDSDSRGTLTQEQIAEIKAKRAEFVVKLDPWGFGGNGVMVGNNFDIADLPDDIVAELRQLVDQGEFDSDFGQDSTSAADMFWSRMIEVALRRGGSIVQRFVSPQPYPVTRLVTINGKSAVEIQQIGDTDVCVSCIGTEMQNILGRASQGGRTNVTGNPGATRVTSIPREVAERVLTLVERYNLAELES